MIANFFQNLREHGAKYLLISGQASVLYGAATFSEDIDLWVDAAPENMIRFLEALRDSHARYYKLTPPFEHEYLRRGHGFHFLLPSTNEPATFLDIMGQPPRCGSFQEARDKAVEMVTDWGAVPTVGIKELVELKKTQRLEDYPVISRLALAWFEQPGSKNNPDELQWAISNLFSLAELRLFLEHHPDALRFLPAELSTLRTFFGEAAVEDETDEQILSQASVWMHQRIEVLQQQDRQYWRPILKELRQLRAEKRLMTEGDRV